MSLATRRVGNDKVSEIGFGAARLSPRGVESASDEDRLQFLDALFEEGCTFWDTADRYGDSEILLGKWFKQSGKRDQIFLATKFGATADGLNNSPEYMKAQIDNSLIRLGTDRIDLYSWSIKLLIVDKFKRVDKNIPIEKTIRAMIRYLGLSEVSAKTLRRAHLVDPIAAVQVEYSPFALDIEEIGLLQACRQLGVTVVAYSPLGSGILTGAYKKHSDLPDNDIKRRVPKYSQENFPKVLEKHNATPSQVTLAWLLAQGQDIIPIPGTKNVKYLKENVGAVRVKLNLEEIAAVRKIVEMANLGGFARYPPEYSDNLYADTVEE
ncbi:Aldo keto reductase [Crepidotus variabilis]|uniref:Aldo keto reductase n=1 Tax=Crepidotus variabilis TaxID=179855 RepID=A0A9P6ET21_9AGAR|nr:Aldo keto reductase [Crepidotus variabilis]